MSSEVTVTEHLLLQQKRAPQATGHFTALFHDLILCAKLIHRSVSKAGLVDILGGTGEINVQGEYVQKLDELSNRILLYRMERSGVLCAMASEENPDVVRVSAAFPRGDYMLIFDPLDGSSNIDVNIDVGTIFSILRRKPGKTGEVETEELLQPGCEQVAAGYFLYGTSTMLVYTTGQGVHGFTLDPSIGEFLLSHPDIRIPEQGNIYSVNEGNWPLWDARARQCVETFRNGFGKPQGCSRYVGALVADFHRTLLNGGIYMYPPDSRIGKSRGKLRYLCEASPLAFIAENAGGAATDGTQRILDIKPTSLHARVPLFIGSRKNVEAVQRIYSGETK
ncbi:MAG: class 1 fructose-bisphosphatase [Desulfovibrionaceae bacterium]|nr:class 1 fructose-bisphosphatase [Desulfovibrionaceae bacterium]